MNTTFKILVVGDHPQLTALTQVLGLLGTHDLVTVDSALFPYISQLLDYLKDYKDQNNLLCIILTGHDGIELAKHIRLTDSLGALRLLPILILSPHSLEYHLRRSRDNIFLLSPEVYLVSVFNCITDLPAVLAKAKPFETIDKMVPGLRPYIAWSDDDDILSSHDNFNRFGPLQLLKEQSLTLPDFLVKSYEDMSSKLWFKKYLFLNPHNIDKQTPATGESDFRNITAGKKVLYIDDEHRLGWSFGLYSLFSGSIESSHNQDFQSKDKIIKSHDFILTCIDNVNDAFDYINAYGNDLNTNLVKYADSEFSKTRYSTESFRTRTKVNSLKIAINDLEIKYKGLEISLKGSQERIAAINDNFRSASDAYMDKATFGNGIVDISDVDDTLRKLTELFIQYKQDAENLQCLKEELQRAKEELLKLKTEYGKKINELPKSEKNYLSASEEFALSVSKLTPSLFPYDLVILDLRLERILDKDREPQDISGVRLLGHIKRIDPSIPVVMFTASEKAINLQQATDLGASGYWIKGVNSLEELKFSIKKSLQKANDARKLWIGIKKVQAKKHLIQFIPHTEHETIIFENMIMDEARKTDIIKVLKESFILFIQEPTPFAHDVCEFDNNRRIAINMGLISEMRFPDLKDKRWYAYSRKYPDLIDDEERKIKKRRNDAAHKLDFSVTDEIAFKVFSDTLERCLRY